MASNTGNRLTEASRRYWVPAMLALGFTLLMVATVLQGFLARKLFVLGSASTLGLTAVVYLAAIWCLAAALLGCVFPGLVRRRA